MKAFEWVSPTSVNEAVTLLKNAPAGTDMDDAARAIAGGQDLLTTMKDYITRPARVVNLKAIRGLDKIEGDGNAVSRSARSSRSRSWKRTPSFVVTSRRSPKPRTRLRRRRYATSARWAAISANARVAGTT